MSDITNQILYSSDTISWTETIDDYPVSTHTIKYYLQKTNEEPAETSHSISGTDHKFTLSVPSTGGTYKFQKKAIAISGGTTTTIDTGYVEIEASLATGFDIRCFNQQVLDALKATLLGRATREQSKIEISGRAIEYLTLQELNNEIENYEAKVYAEEREKNGQNAVPSIRIQFGQIT